MIEIIKHALGLCGESHPNIFAAILGTSEIGGYIHYSFLKIKLYAQRRYCSK